MDNLRLILIGCGILLVAGIYVWEVFRRKRSKRSHLLDELDQDVPEGLDNFRESLFATPVEEPEHQGAQDARNGDRMMEIGDLQAIASDERERHIEAFGGMADVEERPPVVRIPPERGNGADHLVVALTLMAPPGERFSGEEIRDALESAGMRHGDMQIFHHYGDADAPVSVPVFSAANVLEPGTFDIEDLESCSTSGLAFFLQLPGEMDGSGAFELMLDTCRQVSKRLGGELRDETRSSLTPQSITHIRERISEFKREQLLRTR